MPCRGAGLGPMVRYVERAALFCARRVMARLCTGVCTDATRVKCRALGALAAHQSEHAQVYLHTRASKPTIPALPSHSTRHIPASASRLAEQWPWLVRRGIALMVPQLVTFLAQVDLALLAAPVRLRHVLAARHLRGAALRQARCLRDVHAQLAAATLHVLVGVAVLVPGLNPRRRLGAGELRSQGGGSGLKERTSNVLGGGV